MANVPISNLTTTWNNVATTFTGIKLNVTDTASAAGSLLMDLQVGGVSRANITKTGNLFLRGNTQNWVLDGNNVPNQLGFYANGVAGGFGVTASGCTTLGLSFAVTVSATPDVLLARDAANTLAQRNGVNAQTHRIYGTYTDGSNYRRLTKTMSTGGVAEIKPEGAGTGASGNVLHISGLPTSNPGPGILWNDAGTVKVGT